jgi:hypothetical protein
MYFPIDRKSTRKMENFTKHTENKGINEKMVMNFEEWFF